MEIMIGVRYHELLESADSIVQMHQAGEKLYALLKHMPGQWDSLRDSLPQLITSEPLTPEERPIDASEPQSEEDKANFILEASEEIWLALDNNEPLKALQILESAKEFLAQNLLEMYPFLAAEKKLLDSLLPVRSILQSIVD